MLSFRLTALCLILAGCAISQPRQGQTAFEVKIGFNDTYSSTTGVLSRRMCGADDVRTQIKLSSEQLDQIGRLAARSGFFSLPSSLPYTRNKDGFITICSPCPYYALDIYHDSQHHRVQWSCNCTHNGIPPIEVRELFLAVTKALDPAISKLPESQCGYM